MANPKSVKPVRSRDGERGSALIMTTVAIIGLMLVSVFVIDYGIVWVSRTQAQAAADAGALAGAVSMAYEDPSDLSRASARAVAVAQQNRVWYDPGDSGHPLQVATSFVTCPDGTSPCIKVDVTRLDLPSAFAHLLGVNSQRVFATATAQATVGQKVECVRPFGLPDRWDEYRGLAEPAGYPDTPQGDPDWNSASTYDTHSPEGPNDPPREPDLYVPPSGDNPGTGYRNAGPDGNPRDRGFQAALKLGDNDTPGWSRLLDLSGSGAATVKQLIIGDSCTAEHSTQVAAPTLPCSTPSDANTNAGCVSVETGVGVVGPVTQGVEELILKDADAYWDGDEVVSSKGYSPRIVPIPTFDPDLFYRQDPTGKTGVIKVTNLLGFFIEGTCKSLSPGAVIEPYNQAVCDEAGPNKPKVVVLGRVVNFRSSGAGGPIGPGVSFLRKVQLVR